MPGQRAARGQARQPSASEWTRRSPAWWLRHPHRSLWPGLPGGVGQNQAQSELVRPEPAGVAAHLHAPPVARAVPAPGRPPEKLSGRVLRGRSASSPGTTGSLGLAGDASASPPERPCRWAPRRTFAPRAETAVRGSQVHNNEGIL